MRLKKIESHEIGRPKFRRSNPVLSTQLYQYRQPQYAVYFCEQGQVLTKQVLFTNVIGNQYTFPGGNVILSPWHTNMVESGQMPNPDVFYAKQISVDFRNDILEIDAQHFVWDSLVYLNISQRPFLQLAAVKLGAAGGIFGLSTAAAASFSNGVPDGMNEFDFSGDQGETILQGQNFNVVVDPTLATDSAGAGVYTAAATGGGGTGIQAKVTLDGLYNRVTL